MKRTLIVVRRMLAEPIASLTGFTIDLPLARFKASIVAFSEERVPSGSFGSWC